MQVVNTMPCEGILGVEGCVEPGRDAHLFAGFHLLVHGILIISKTADPQN
jgi:hypothetical protein